MFGDRLKQLRKQKKLRQEDIANKLGIARTTYAMYEQNSREPDFETLQKLADLFGVSTDYLLGRINDPAPPDHNPGVSNALPPLTPKDERDIGRDLERILNNLESEEALAFQGEPLDEETKELLRISLESSMRLAKQIAKQKFTPKKHRK